MAIINPEWIIKQEGSFQTAEEMNTLAVAVKNNAIESQTDINNLSAHINNKSNPHEVTKIQLDLENVDNVSDTNKPVSIAQASAIAAVQADFNSHEADKANPHSVTKAQIGLGDADNTSDVNKPVSAAQQIILDNKINLNGLNSNIDELHFNPETVSQLSSIGDVRYSPESKTLEVKVSDTVSVQLGQEMQTRVKNDAGVQINNGQLVYINSAVGANPLAALASTTDTNISQRTFGMATENIIVNGFGAITTEGLVRDINTIAFPEGSMLYLGVNGAFTNIEPTAPTPKISVGMVLRSHASKGVVYVKIRAIARNQKLSDVYAPTMTNGDVLRWNSATLRFETFNVTASLDTKVTKTGNETIADIKTFTSSPIVPTPTADMQVSTKKYVDDNKTTIQSKQVIAGTGLTGGGDLSTDRTLSVVSANDGITVNADNIQLNTIDNVTTPSITKPLSANQGKVLNDNLVQLGADLNTSIAEVEQNIGKLDGKSNYELNLAIGARLESTNLITLPKPVVKGDVISVKFSLGTAIYSGGGLAVYYFDENGNEITHLSLTVDVLGSWTVDVDKDIYKISFYIYQITTAGTAFVSVENSDNVNNSISELQADNISIRSELTQHEWDLNGAIIETRNTSIASQSSITIGSNDLSVPCSVVLDIKSIGGINIEIYTIKDGVWTLYRYITDSLSHEIEIKEKSSDRYVLIKNISDDSLSSEITIKTKSISHIVSINTEDIDLIDDRISNVETLIVAKEDKNNFYLDNHNLLRYKEVGDQVGYIGRWYEYKDLFNNTHKATNNQGSELYFKVKGTTSVDVNFGVINAMTPAPFIAISIDGAEFTRQSIETKTINLPNSNEHIVRIVVDAMNMVDGAHAFYKYNNTYGVIFDGITTSGTIIGLEPTNKLIMFFGDSVTEGIRALGVGDDASYYSAVSAYPRYCCDALNAVSHRVGYGATRMYPENEDGTGGSFGNCLTAVNYIHRYLETTTTYPDVIVINHGINDSYGNVLEVDFISAYREVLKRLRVKYSSTPIICVVAFRSVQPYSSAINSLCEEFSNCYYVSSDGWNGETTDGTHLSDVGAKNNGVKLSDEIKKILGKNFFIC